MLKIIEDDAHDCFVLEPSGSLRKADLDALTERFNARVARADRSRTWSSTRRSFPTWSDFARAAEHIRFIRDHHRQIEKVALVSDARILDFAPRVARLFVAARICATFPPTRWTTRSPGWRSRGPSRRAT